MIWKKDEIISVSTEEEEILKIVKNRKINKEEYKREKIKQLKA